MPEGRVVRGTVGEPEPDPLFANGGETGRATAAHDWGATPLGPPRTWPPELRSIVRVLLTSEFSMWMGWGEDLTVFYNDAYQRDTLRTKHPWAIGRPAREVWAEIWPDIGPRIQSVIDTGRATWDEGLLLFLERSGYREETYHTFSYSPLSNAAGTVEGFLCVVSEDTQRVLSERRLRILSELGDISAVNAPTVDEACAAAFAVLERGRRDVPFASIYLLEPDGDSARRAAFFGMLDDERIVPHRLWRGRAPGLPAWAALDTGRSQPAGGLTERFSGLFLPSPLDPDLPAPGRPGPDQGAAEPASVLAIPLAGGGAGGQIGVLFAGISPYRALDPEYELFLDLVAGQINTAIADAQAFQYQRRRAEDLAELDRAKTDFFTGVSHELRTPLTLIAGPAEDSLADPAEPLPPGQRARMEIIQRNAGRLRRLVDTMLDFARLERDGLTADRTAVDLAELTRGITESFAPAIRRAGLRLDVDCPPLPSAAAVDVDMWEKIVLNLLSNALKYTPAGAVGVSLRATGDGVALVVTDTGVGIPAAEVPRLFQRFHRVQGVSGRSHEGSGIGLALVAELTTLHGGTVGVDSTPGEGSTFTVVLPPSVLTDERPARLPGGSPTAQRYREEALQWSDPDPDPLPVEPPASGTAEATVLVVEDNADLRRFLVRLLRPHYDVVTAPDGRTAMDLAAARPPDLVLTDVMMPGVDGFALLAALRANPATATAPVVMLSARAGEGAAIEGLEAGADDYLVKPFSSHDLLARVRSNITLARLRTAEATWRRALVEALQDGFFVIDEDNAIIEVNDAFEAITGYGSDGLPYREPYPWVPAPEDDAESAAAVTAVLRSGRSERITARIVHRDNRRIWVESVFNTAKDPATGRTVRVGTLRDVTAARLREQTNGLLAEIGRQQTAPGSLAARLRRVLRAAAPLLGDAAVVAARGPDGTLAPIAAGAPGDPRLEHELAGGSTSASWSVLTVPAGPGPEAVLSFVSTRRERAHDDADRALAADIGDRVGRMVAAERAAVRDARMHRLTTAFSAAATVDDAARALADGTAELLGAASVTVLVARPGLEPVHQLGGPPLLDARDAVGPHPLTDCVRTASALWFQDDADRTARYPHLPRPPADDGRADTDRGCAALPLVVGSRVVGVLSLTFPTRREVTDDDRALAADLAVDGGRALERVALSELRQEMAETLQRSLLPAALPELARLDLAAYYVPAAWGSLAGGDWYDVLELDEHRVAVVVGDVVGQGPTAAAIMGQLRSALAAYLLDEHSPAEALLRLDRFARQVRGARGSSVVCLVLDTRDGSMRWARAGHPPPLVVDATGAHYLEDAHGSVLGVRGTPPFVEAGATLAPGASLLLCTDGLIERRTEVIDDGLARLAAAAAAHAAERPEVLTPAVLRHALDDRGPADDIAVVVARLRPAPLRQELPAVPARLSAVRRAVDEWARQAALPDEQRDDLQFTLGEALANSVEHAYRDRPPGTMTYEIALGSRGAVHVEVLDQGCWRPPAAAGHRGRGVEMIHALARDVDVRGGDEGTTVRFTVAGPAAPAAPVAAPPTPAVRDGAARSGARLDLVVTDDHELHLRLSGELDLASVASVRAPVLESARAHPGPVVLDLRGVTFLGSAGAALLIDAARSAAGGVRLLTAPDGPVDRVLALAGIDPRPAAGAS